MVIENRPGAGSIIGTEAVSHAAPDGNTLLIINPTFVMNPHLRKVNYDPVTGDAARLVLLQHLGLHASASLSRE
jgi:tripartite-type tricarboxylate transporter receptor subunit TctC